MICCCEKEKINKIAYGQPISNYADHTHTGTKTSRKNLPYPICVFGCLKILNSRRLEISNDHHRPRQKFSILCLVHEY